MRYTLYCGGTMLGDRRPETWLTTSSEAVDWECWVASDLGGISCDESDRTASWLSTWRNLDSGGSGNPRCHRQLSVVHRNST
jgi:hypothetical protein